MKRLLTIGAFLFISLSSLAQDYSYSFNGELSNPEELLKELEAIPQLINTKIKYKEDSKRGEIWFDLKTSKSRTDTRDEFSPVSIKTLLLSNGLEPLTFKSRTQNK